MRTPPVTYQPPIHYAAVNSGCLVDTALRGFDDATMILRGHRSTCCHAGYEALFREATERLEAMGGRRVAKFDFAPFAQTAGMLYQSAFIAERYAGAHLPRLRLPGARHCQRMQRQLRVDTLCFMTCGLRAAAAAQTALLLSRRDPSVAPDAARAFSALCGSHRRIFWLAERHCKDFAVQASVTSVRWQAH